MGKSAPVFETDGVDIKTPETQDVDDSSFRHYVTCTRLTSYPFYLAILSSSSKQIETPFCRLNSYVSLKFNDHFGVALSYTGTLEDHSLKINT